MIGFVILVVRENKNGNSNRLILLIILPGCSTDYGYRWNVGALIMKRQLDLNDPSLRMHGSPMDRGSADAYYWRPRSPHKYPNGTYNGERVTDLTPEEIEEYNFGYDNETDRKIW